MRYRLMATYQGVPYEAGIGPSDGDVVLFAACPPPEELGFEPATGHWRKQLRLQDVQALWESRPTGSYRGQRCLVLDDLGDRLHIAYLGHDAYQAQQLGYWQVDRGVFELVTPREEVTEVTEERFDYPGQPAGLPGEQLPAADYDPATGPVTADYGPVTADYGPVTADFAVRPPGSMVAAPTPPDFGAASSPGRPFSAPAPQPGFTVIPPASEAPLPLEAAALRAASAAKGRQENGLAGQPAGPVTAPPRRRRSARSRMATQGIFIELATLAAIPPAAYAVGEEVDGALCLIDTATGYEVFSAAGGARHEVRVFEDEESAYFYLFGVLAAEAVRTGLLIPRR
jgi:hypothetical protein